MLFVELEMVIFIIISKWGPFMYCNLYLLSVISYIKRGFVRVCVSPLPQLQTVIKRLIMSKEAFRPSSG